MFFVCDKKTNQRGPRGESPKIRQYLAAFAPAMQKTMTPLAAIFRPPEVDLRVQPQNFEESRRPERRQPHEIQGQRADDRCLKIVQL
jgi:hypothetical protein